MNTPEPGKSYVSAFGPHERYTVELHNTAWEMATSGALLAGWKAARELGVGLTPEQADKIALAAMWRVRDMVERRALDQRE